MGELSANEDMCIPIDGTVYTLKFHQEEDPGPTDLKMWAEVEDHPSWHIAGDTRDEIIDEARKLIPDLIKAEKEVGLVAGTPESSASSIMKFFAYKHLPENLQEISAPLCLVAEKYDRELKPGAEKSAGLRKLLEAKDCFVRAAL